ncbi:MAG TPA: YqgE/AlgH family protein [Xanthobacteraceae bacterium]|jgi:putative transcriptional regulator|nr:YqgE/AlgH family protein [Xanthobacteraceae bacterium]
MPFIAAQRLILAVLVLSAALTATSPHATEAPPSLKGQFLIATPAMRDPRFDHAVILMVRHDSDGALGIVINRPLGEKPLTDLLAVFGNKDATASGNVRIFLGGPVQPEVSFVIHGADYRRAETLDIDARLAATPSSAVLPDMARSAGPTKSLIAFGYAGWAPGQLEGELARNVWYTAPADPALVFDDDRDKVWEHATARRTQDL